MILWEISAIPKCSMYGIFAYLEPQMKVNPPKQGLFQSKQWSFGFQVCTGLFSHLYVSTHIWFTFVPILFLHMWNRLNSCQNDRVQTIIVYFRSPCPFSVFVLWGAMCKDGVHQIYLTLEECVHVEGRGLWCWVVFKSPVLSSTAKNEGLKW